MNNKANQSLQHSHSFGQDQKRSGEARTIIVIIITAAMMVIEITTGVIYGSIALLVDGLHMASHTAALMINLVAYIYARKHAFSNRFSFGTGKVNALGGFAGAVLLVVFTLIMVWESIDRLLNPVEISYNQAIIVAIIGLIVNGVSVFILQDKHDHSHEYHHDEHHEHEGGDQNLRAAYLHVLADAVTSLTAIFALLTGKYFDWAWMDPVMGFVGAGLVLRWSAGLLRSTTGVLLDKQGSEKLVRSIRSVIEIEAGTKVTDLHLWLIGPEIYCLVISLTARRPENPKYYKELLPKNMGLVHITIEVNDSDRQQI